MNPPIAITEGETQEIGTSLVDILNLCDPVIFQNDLHASNTTTELVLELDRKTPVGQLWVSSSEVIQVPNHTVSNNGPQLASVALDTMEDKEEFDEFVYIHIDNRLLEAIWNKDKPTIAIRWGDIVCIPQNQYEKLGNNFDSGDTNMQLIGNIVFVKKMLETALQVASAKRLTGNGNNIDKKIEKRLKKLFP